MSLTGRQNFFFFFYCFQFIWLYTILVPNQSSTFFEQNNALGQGGFIFYFLIGYLSKIKQKTELPKSCRRMHHFRPDARCCVSTSTRQFCILTFTYVFIDNKNSKQINSKDQKLSVKIVSSPHETLVSLLIFFNSSYLSHSADLVLNI